MRDHWSPDNHFLISVLSYVKQLFFISSFDAFDCDSPLNDTSDIDYIENKQALLL